MLRSLDSLLGVGVPLLCLTAVATICFASTALAQEQPSQPFLSDIEFTLGVGLMDRGTTGIGAPLLGHGYDHAVGAVLEGDLRVLKQAGHRVIHHGLALRAFHQDGRTLGLTDSGSFQVSGLDLAYVFRALLPCMSSDDVRFHLSPLAGLSGLRARAGNLSARSDQTGELTNAAHAAFDHTALGVVLGVQFDVHHGPFLVAVTADLREHFALGNTPVSRNFMTSLALRVGFDLDL